jgi:hypothetical protein
MFYPELQKYYGTPISQLPRPNIPFRLKTEHYVIGAAILCLAAYGAYRIYKDNFDPERNKL